MAKVDVMVACSKGQSHKWWGRVMGRLLYEQGLGIHIRAIHTASAALPDHNKTNITDDRPYASVYEKGRNKLTDANRLKIAESFLKGDADWLFSMDDDTVPPLGALTQLLNSAKPFSAGLYFNTSEPYNPIAYIRRNDGLYVPYMGYVDGTFSEVDSVGMGCTLIHRTVFEKIEEEHVVYQMPTGALYPVHKDNILDDPQMGFLPADPDEQKEWVEDGVLHIRVSNIPIKSENRPFPFFVLQYGRTEDHHFCELANNVGFKPWLDTTIVCTHIKDKETDDESYRQEFIRMLESGEAYTEPS